MWSGSDYGFSMAARDTSRKRRVGLAFAAWLSLAFGVYAVLSVASIWGFVAGAVAASLGGVIALAVVSDRPGGRTSRVAKVALALNALALAIVAAVLIALGVG